MPLPPGPRAPAAVQTAAWVAAPDRFLLGALRHHGDPCTIRIAWAGGPMVLTADPDAAAAVFAEASKPDGALAAGGASPVLEPFAGPSSILLLSGTAHLEERRRMLPAFHGEALVRMRGEMAAVAREHVARWPRGTTITTHDRFAALTLDVILRVVFGARDPAMLHPLRDAVRHALALTHHAPRLVAMSLVRRDLGPRSPYGAFLRAVRRVDELLAPLIAGTPAGPDSALGLLKAADDDAARLRDRLVTLLAAGHETTATALAWAAERLARHPDVQAWARGDDARLAATADEVLRTRPVLSIAPRTTTRAHDLRGHRLEPGTIVAPCLLALLRDPAAWGADAAAFRPDRGHEGAAYVPWGGGTRRCLGAAFARAEMVEVLRAVLDAADLRPDRAAPEPARRRSVTIGPARGGSVMLVAR